MRTVIRTTTDRDREWSRRVRAEPKDCFRTAVRVLVNLPPGQYPEAAYVEGYARCLSLGVTMYHGWVELRPDDVLDAAAAWCVPDRTNEYGAVRRWTRRQVMAVWGDNDSLTLPLSGPNEWVDPAFRAMYLHMNPEVAALLAPQE